MHEKAFNTVHTKASPAWQNSFLAWRFLVELRHITQKKHKHTWKLKCDNPAGVPEARSIEDFWSILKALYTRKSGETSEFQ